MRRVLPLKGLLSNEEVLEEIQAVRREMEESRADVRDYRLSFSWPERQTYLPQAPQMLSGLHILESHSDLVGLEGDRPCHGNSGVA